MRLPAKMTTIARSPTGPKPRSLELDLSVTPVPTKSYRPAVWIDCRTCENTRSPLVLTLAAGTTLLARDWPQWRGPSLNGVSREAGLPTKWSATEGVAWKLPLPAFSGATPVIWNDLVFLNVATARATGSIELWAVDRNTHQPIWKRPMSDGNRIGNKQNMSSPSPVTDGRRVWAMTGTGVIKAFDFAGKELWMRDLQKEHGAFGLQFGYGSSPLLHEGALYIQVLHGFFTDDAVVRDEDRRDDRQDRVADRAADAGAAMSRPTRTRRRRSYNTTARPRSSRPAAISSPVTIRRPARSSGAPTSSIPKRARNFRSDLVAAHRRRPDHRAEPRQPARGDAPGRRPATSPRRTSRGRSTAGPTCRRR